MKEYKTANFRRHVPLIVATVFMFSATATDVWARNDGPGQTAANADAGVLRLQRRDPASGSKASKQVAAAGVVTAPRRKSPDTLNRAGQNPGQGRQAQPPAPANSGMENIVVTAQKREQNIRDVPISMSVLNNQFIQQMGITGFSDLGEFVPNVQFRTDVPTGVSLNIRGFTKQSGNPAFDQAVGLLQDGIPYEDNDYFVTGLFDVKQIEVLRGPQGTLQGANTTAGLINVTTKGPTDTTKGSIDVQAGQYGKKRVEGGIGGPLIPGVLNYRLAGVTDQINGTIDNTTEPNNKGLEHDRSGVRLKLEAPDLLGSTWGLAYERDKASYSGLGREIRSVNPKTAQYLRQFDPNLDIVPYNYKASIVNPSTTDRNINKLTGYWTNDFSGWNLKFLTGYGNVNTSVGIGNGLPAPFSRTLLGENKKQYTAELEANSPRLLDEFDFTGGVLYLHRDLDLNSRLNLNDSVATGLVTADANGPVLPPPGANPPTEASTIVFRQHSNSIAGYGQGNWYFADRWTATAGLRLTQEYKSATFNRRFDSPSAPLLKSTLGYQSFNASKNRSEFDASPKAALNYKPLDNVSFFLVYARGFRSGGFNAAAPNDINNLSYGSEKVNDYEFISKMQFFDDALRVSVDFYRMDLNDFQVLTTPPSPNSANTQGGVVVNSGGARAQGVETSATWLATDWLTVNAAAAYNDAFFTDFKKGPCASDRSNSDGDSDPRCDVTGSQLPDAPHFTATVSPTLHYPIAHGLQLQLGATGFYTSSQTTGIPGDDRFRQGSYFKLNAFVGVGNPDQGWSAKLVGKNLTDKAVNRKVQQITATSNFTQDLEPPRIIYGQVTFRYQ